MAKRPKGDDMREIKFRAWHYEAGNPMYKPYMQYSSGDFDLPLFWRHVADEPCSVEVMQYTGLKDKNGVEIYEGDIIKREDKNNIFSKGHDIYQVTYSQSKGSFHLNPSTFDHLGDGLFCVDGKNISEVVGNIYQNSELLEK